MNPIVLMPYDSIVVQGCDTKRAVSQLLLTMWALLWTTAARRRGHDWQPNSVGNDVLEDKTHLIAEDDVVLHPAEKDEIQSHVDHPQVGTQRMQVAKHTGGEPVTRTHLLGEEWTLRGGLCLFKRLYLFQGYLFSNCDNLHRLINKKADFTLFMSFILNK